MHCPGCSPNPEEEAAVAEVEAAEGGEEGVDGVRSLEAACGIIS